MRLISYLTPGYPASLFEAIADYIDVELTLLVDRSGPDPDDDPFADGRAELGWLCSTSFVELTTGRSPSVQEVGVAWVPDDPDAHGRPVYFSDIVVRGDSPIRSFDDLRGLRIACNDPASLSGFHSLRIELNRRGLEPSEFAELALTGGHHRSLDQVIAGDVDAAVIDSIVRRNRSRDSDAVDSLRVIARLGPWPTQPLVMSADADAVDVAAIRQQVLRSQHEPHIAALLAQAGLVGLAATDGDHCETVRAAMSALDSADTHARDKAPTRTP